MRAISALLSGISVSHSSASPSCHKPVFSQISSRVDPAAFIWLAWSTRPLPSFSLAAGRNIPTIDSGSPSGAISTNLLIALGAAPAPVANPKISPRVPWPLNITSPRSSAAPTVALYAKSLTASLLGRYGSSTYSVTASFTAGTASLIF